MPGFYSVCFYFQTGSGLSSLLPKPRHSVTATSNNPNKPTAKLSKRPLIPHTLTKKPEPPKKGAKRIKKSEDDGSGDEDDGEPVAFFSFSENKRDTESSITKDSEKIKSKNYTSVNILGEGKPLEVEKTHNKSETITSRLEVDSTGYSAAMNYGTPGVDSADASVSYGGEGSSYGSTPAVSHYYDTSEDATTTTYYQPTGDPNQQYVRNIWI